MAKKSFEPLEDLPFSESITVNFIHVGGADREWRFKERSNLPLEMDTKIAGAMIEAVAGQVVDEEQGDFRKELSSLWRKDAIDGNGLAELLNWVDEERSRLRKEAVAAATGHPTGAPSVSGD